VEHVFKRFYPAERFARPQPPSDEFSENDLASARLPGGLPIAFKLEHYYTPAELDALAVEFADLAPDESYSVAELQGYLLNKKWDPQGAVDNLSAWLKDQEEEKKRIEEVKQKKKLLAAQRRKAAREFFEGNSKVVKENTINNQSDEEKVAVTEEVVIDPSDSSSTIGEGNLKVVVEEEGVAT
jgi:chaperone BCS1